MGPPSQHSRPPPQLTFDNAYNFHGSAHVMTQPMQDFPVQLPQHHPFTVASRTPHTPAPPIYHEPSAGYHSPGLNGQSAAGLPYHVSMTAGTAAAADKNSLIQLSAGGAGGVRQAHAGVVHHQGNLQPGYPPRPLETSSRSCDKLSAAMTAVTSSCTTVSTGYPGNAVTGLQPVTQDERVTSSVSRSAKHHTVHHTKDNSPLLLPPPPDYGSRVVAPSLLSYPAPAPEFTSLLTSAPAPGVTSLHSPSSQQTFLACRAAEERATDDNTHHQVCLTGGTEFVLHQTPSLSLDNHEEESLSSLARTSAAPNTQEEDINNNKQQLQHSFVSTKALLFSTSHQNNSSLIQSNNFEDTSLIPQFDGASDPDYCPADVEENNYLKPIQSLTNSGRKSTKSRKPQMEGRDEENITLRTPLEVYNDVLQDQDFIANLTDEQKHTLTDRANNLKEISPLCSCAQQGLQGNNH